VGHLAQGDHHDVAGGPGHWHLGVVGVAGDDGHLWWVGSFEEVGHLVEIGHLVAAGCPGPTEGV
jgi:hypothetical protein